MEGHLNVRPRADDVAPMHHRPLRSACSAAQPHRTRRLQHGQVPLAAHGVRGLADQPRGICQRDPAYGLGLAWFERHLGEGTHQKVGGVGSAALKPAGNEVEDLRHDDPMPLFDRTLIAFDIECIPDPEMGRRGWELSGTDVEVVQAMVERRLSETGRTNRYPALPWHRVVCICATTLEPSSDRIELLSLGTRLGDEKAILQSFFELFRSRERAPRLVSWNGGGYDLPVIRYRAMRHGVQAPELYAPADDERYNTYQNRYQDLHVDVMDVLSGYGASMRAGLGATSELLGLPGKSFLEGEVYEHWLGGEHERVVEYCKLDTLETLLAFLAYAHHTGELSTAD